MHKNIQRKWVIAAPVVQLHALNCLNECFFDPKFDGEPDVARHYCKCVRVCVRASARACVRALRACVRCVRAWCVFGCAVEIVTCHARADVLEAFSKNFHVVFERGAIPTPITRTHVRCRLHCFAVR